MTNPRRGLGGVLWGLALIAAGMLLLARNVGYEIPIWAGIATYWPLLLVVWGGVKVVDYVQLRRSGENRRLFSPAEVFLLIFMILAGTAASAVTNLSPSLVNLLEMAEIDILPITGDEYAYTERYESTAVPGAGIEVINRYGGVEILPSDGDLISVEVQKTVIAATEEEADDLARLLTFSIEEQSSRYRVASTFNRDVNSVRGRRIRTSLVVRVPAASNVRIDNRNGPVRIQNLAGDQTIANQFGEVEIRDVAGGVQIANRNGRVVARNVGGDLTIDARNGDVEVAGVGGSAEISNSFATTIVSGVAGALAIRGENNEVDIDGVMGPLDVETRFQDVRIRNAGNEIRVSNRNGDVELRFQSPPEENVVVTTAFSSVTLEVPDSSLNLDLFTRVGDIETDFGFPVSTEGPERSLASPEGTEGPTIRIRTRNGDIRVHRM